MRNLRGMPFLVSALLVGGVCIAQQDVTIMGSASDAAQGLDLKAVSELFKESKNLEEFEKSLNDSEVGVNNLDLDGNGEVDYLRVVDEVSGNTHVIILQASLARDEFQDVATIEVEKKGAEKVNLQLHGNEVLYGPSYYVVPSHVHFHTWPSVVWIYGPHYRPYRSPYYFGYHPRWWRPYRPVTVNVYRTRTVTYTRRTTYRVQRKTTVKTVNRVNYQPQSSRMVRTRTTGATAATGVRESGRGVGSTRARAAGSGKTGTGNATAARSAGDPKARSSGTGTGNVKAGRASSARGVQKAGGIKKKGSANKTQKKKMKSKKKGSRGKPRRN